MGVKEGGVVESMREEGNDYFQSVSVIYYSNGQIHHQAVWGPDIQCIKWYMKYKYLY